MKCLYLIVVGKLKDAAYQTIEDKYLKRIKNPPLKIIETRSSAENKEQEAEEVLKKISEIDKSQKPFIVLLAENGKALDSPQFSEWLEKSLNRGKDNIFFVIGGADGHGQKILTTAAEKISLSALTFPHRMARIILVEQLYRAQTLLQGHPYHK